MDNNGQNPPPGQPQYAPPPQPQYAPPPQPQYAPPPQPQYAPPPQPQYAPPPPKLKKKKGYVAPIIWLIIGGIGCAWIIGIPIVILALIALSMRVSRNKKIEVENAQIMMQYSAQYGARPPYYP